MLAIHCEVTEEFARCASYECTPQQPAVNRNDIHQLFRTYLNEYGTHHVTQRRNGLERVLPI